MTRVADGMYSPPSGPVTSDLLADERHVHDYDSKNPMAATSTNDATASSSNASVAPNTPPAATTTAPSSPAKTVPTGSIKTMVACNEVQDFILIEIINPQVCVHSEETRGNTNTALISAGC